MLIEWAGRERAAGGWIGEKQYDGSECGPRGVMSCPQTELSLNEGEAIDTDGVEVTVCRPGRKEMARRGKKENKLLG